MPVGAVKAGRPAGKEDVDLFGARSARRGPGWGVVPVSANRGPSRDGISIAVVRDSGDNLIVFRIIPDYSVLLMREYRRRLNHPILNER